MKSAVALSEFERLFPFCFVADEHGTILHLGPTLKKFLSNGVNQNRFDHIFEVIRPVGRDFTYLVRHAKGEMIKLKLSTKNTEFMGQILSLTPEGHYLFTINMMVQDADELTAFGLTFNDFAIQDPIFDFLMLLQTQKRAIRQSETMNKKLIEAHKIATQASETKSQFLANMSHELRTPLNGLIGMASILADTNLDEDQKDYVQTLISSAESMLALVNDILDLSKIEAGFIQLNVNLVQFPQLFQDIFDMVSPIANKKCLQLQLNLPARLPMIVFADPLRLQQVIVNLVGNAIKFTSSGSVTVGVDLVSTSEKKSEIQITFTDTGIGMSPETLSRIFSPFVQGDSSMTKKFEGTGLGLSICKKLVETMEGKISVKSEEGKGTVFQVNLPFDLPEEQQFLALPLKLENSFDKKEVA